MAQRLNILYEDNHLLAIVKPPGLATMGLAEGETTLLTLAKDDIKRRYQKPGNVYLGVVSRLDTPVSGVVLLARTSKAAKRLNEQFRERTVEKSYLALVEGHVRASERRLVHWLQADKRHRRVHVVAPNSPEAKEAVLSFHRQKRFSRATLVAIRLETGRKHQIRSQMAAIGHPILGDRKYGAAQAFPDGIALHAQRLVVRHPVGGHAVEIEAPLPDCWDAFLQ